MLFVLNQPAILLGLAVGILVGIEVHNLAQLGAARLLGDSTARREGFDTLDPRKHFSPYSVVAILLVGYGWAQPVPVAEQWRQHRFRATAILAAGPAAYLVLAILSLLALRATPHAQFVLFTGPSGFAQVVLYYVAETFVTLLVVSLIPVPPLDCGRAIFLLGPVTPGWQRARYQLEQNNVGLAIVLVLLLLPLLLGGRATVVGQFAPELLRGLGHLAGLR